MADASTTTLVKTETPDNRLNQTSDEIELPDWEYSSPVEPASALDGGFENLSSYFANYQLGGVVSERADASDGTGNPHDKQDDQSSPAVPDTPHDKQDDQSSPAVPDTPHDKQDSDSISAAPGSSDGIIATKEEEADAAEIETSHEPDQVVDATLASIITSSTIVPTNVNDNVSVFVVHPADRGRHAYIFLLKCFVLEAFVWGFPFSYGVFQAYYAKTDQFSNASVGIAAVGASALGTLYLFAPISLFIGEHWPNVRKTMSLFGLCIMFAGLINSVFASKIWHLIITQGVLYGIGGSLMYSPTISYLDDWFIERKALAMGAMWAGAGTAGLAFPFLLSILLEWIDNRFTLLFWGLGTLFICGPILMHLGPRTQNNTPITRDRMEFWFMTEFMIMAVSNIFQGLGFFIPALYLPQYIGDLGYSNNFSLLILAALNTSSVVGSVLFGAMCDRIHVKWAMILSSFVSVATVLVCWGLYGTSVESLVMFAILYGVSAGGWSSIWMGMIYTVRDSFPTASITMLSGIFAATRGIGSICSGPIAGNSLGSLDGSIRRPPKSGFESEYFMLILLTIVFIAIAGVFALFLPGWTKFRRYTR